MTLERLEAVGGRGEACIIVRETPDSSYDAQTASFRLATGERLRSTDQPGEFETLDGRRRFVLRRLRPEHAPK
jgi:hypothetical protein